MDGFSWVNKEFIKRLIDRFTLSDKRGTPEAWPMLKAIYCTTDVDRLLTETAIGVVEDDTSIDAAGTHQFGQVPLGKRWKVYAYHIFVGSSNTANLILVGNENNSVEMNVASFSAASQFYGEFTNPLPLDENWRIKVNINSYVAPETGYCKLLVEESDAY